MYTEDWSGKLKKNKKNGNTCYSKLGWDDIAQDERQVVTPAPVIFGRKKGEGPVDLTN